MKKRLFGYHTQEVDSTINTLKEENLKLNSSIDSLDTKLKSINADINKLTSLEAELEKSQLEIQELTSHNQDLALKLKSLSAELYKLQEENILLTAQLEEFQAKKKIEDYKAYEEVTPLSESTTTENDILLLKEQVQLLSSEKESLITENKALEKELNSLKQNNSEHMSTLEHMKSMDKRLESKQSLASEISLRAFWDMSRLNNEVADKIHEMMKDYYKFVNDNNIQIRSELEQYQREYNQMINNFVIAASKLPSTLTNIENKYTSLANYSINTEALFQSMNHTINKFMTETTESLKDN